MKRSSRVRWWSFASLVFGTLALAPVSHAELGDALQKKLADRAARTAENAADKAAGAGATTDWWSQIRGELERQEYAGSATEGGWQAPNRAQNLRARFQSAGVELVPRAEGTGAWRWRWETTAWGRDGSMRDVSPVAPVSRGGRIEYPREALVEWYENRKEGLEQGFTVSARPEGAGLLRIEGRVAAELHARPSEDGQAVEFLDAHGACVLRYGKLIVMDARGTRLDAHLEVARGSIAIEVDDRDASYPLMVDPLMTSPAWTAESDQVGAQFGGAVATAGDVNGDGYSDVIIGAAGFDNGEVNEGRAFVYLGSAAGLAATAAWTVESHQPGAFFGRSVATAGDVNGDGYSDVIVGTNLYSNGQTSEGGAWIYLGSASGLDTTAAWSAEGSQVGAYLGCSVATAGDVNGDGYSDVIVGAYRYSNGQSIEGRAYVYLGSASGLDTTAAWSAESDQVDASFGASVATAGDVNGDGYSDVIVGAFAYDNDLSNEGKAYVYLGSAAGLAGVAAWTAEGDQLNAEFAYSVASAGDVNGDGYSDVIVGARLYDIGQTDEGWAFVYLGSATGLAATAAWSAEGNLTLADFGRSVATAGDINGDGYSDVIVGAPFYTNDQANEGRAYVYLGSASGLAATATWTAESNQAGGITNAAGFALCVATAGDVNGDGYSDVIVGATAYDNGQTDEGRAYVYHGSAAGLIATAAWTVEPDQVNAQFGNAVAAAGDVNGDGYSDVVVGANLYDNGETDEGRAYLYLGTASGLSATAAWTAESDQVNAQFGYSVATAGDVNGDGYSDVIVGAPLYDNVEIDEGRAYVYLGSASGLAVSAAWTAESDQDSANFGHSVATAGNVDGDGYSDVIVGAQRYDNGQADEGRAYVYLGSASGLAATAAWTAESDQANAQFANSVALAGDVNRDGYSDVIVGADQYDNGETDEGRALVYLGSATGLAVIAGWTAESGQVDARFGNSVATAGDVNGDGYSDVIIGACRYDNGQVDEGRAHVYLGSGLGLAASAVWTTEINQVGANLGNSVATAGDVNGDGYSDVIVGANLLDYFGVNVGRPYVYLGSASGPAATSTWGVEGIQANSQFGSSVASAGDVNGDGYSDVIVSAPLYDNVEADEGRAYVYYGNQADGLDRTPRQFQADNSAPIHLLGKSASDAFRLHVLGRSPAGRGNIRMEWEAKPLGVAFGATGHGVGPAFDTGAPVIGIGSATALDGLVSDLLPDTAYHWRLRVLTDSPFFPRSPWFSLAHNNPSETDLRTGGSPSAVPGPVIRIGGLRVEMVRPNPSSARAEILYVLPRADRVALWVHDLQGRRLATLVNGVQEAGPHSVAWDGRDQHGRLVGAGVYWARLRSGGEAVARKFIRE